MAEKLPIPAFKKGSSVSSFEKEVEAWEIITNIAQAKRAIVLALNLEEDVKNRIFENVTMADLNKNTGVRDVIKYIKNTYGKDELTDSRESYKDFRDYKRKTGQDIGEYISEFSSRVNKLKNKGVTVVNEILAFELIERANITAVEEKLVCTGIDFSKKDDMFEDAKNSLKKFIRDTAIESTNSAIKVEAVNEASHEVAFNNVQRNQNARRQGYNYYQNNYYKQMNRGSTNNGPKLNQGYPQNMQNRNFQNNNNWNPKDRNGQTSKCFRCGSPRHFIKNCPRKENSFMTVCEDEEQYLPMVNNEEESPVMILEQKSGSLSIEARGCAVIDTACASTVTGEKWLKDYIENHLNCKDQNKVIKKEGKKVFRFGAGPPVKSMFHVTIPAIIGGKKVSIATDVVNNDIPLLLSIASIKNANGVIFTKDLVISLFGKRIPCVESSTGHWMMPLIGEIDINEVWAVDICTLKGEELRKTLQKLHAQFGHPSEKKLTYLLKNANMWSEDCNLELTKIQNGCQICKQFSKTPARPVVALPLAEKFNEAVCMDLKQWRGLWILHMVDMYSRYTQSVWVTRKSSKDILDAILENWVGVFGVMNTILTDNGGEFTSEEIREVTSFLNVKKYTTAAESPWQNGLCERVHAVTDQIMMKLHEEYPNTKIQTLLKWANMAKNSLHMNNGFTPHQLVFGINPNLPNIMNAKLPALQVSTTSEIFGKHLNLMQIARKAYIEAENSERIKRALRHNIRSNQDTFKSGEDVYYKREDSEKWLGPGKVMFQDGKIIFVRHGSVYVKVSATRLIKANENTNIEVRPKTINEENQSQENKNQTKNLPVNIEKEKIEASNTRKSCRLQEKERIDYQILDRGEIDDIEETEVYITTIPKEEQNTQECMQAKISELEKLKEYGVYQEVEDGGFETLSTRWVMTIKEGEPRARLVVRGFEEEEIVQKDSPTVSKSAMRVLFVVAASKSWEIKTTDIKSAFLQGKELDRTVYIRPPKEARTKEKRVVWKLQKCLYGLSDASRQFYMAVRDVLITCNCKQSSVEPSLFYLLDKNRHLRGALVSHIDDFLHGGDAFFEENVIKPLINRFTAGKIKEKSFTYVGFQITQNNKGITMNQNNYIKDLSEDSWITPKRNKNCTLTKEEQTEYRGMVGSINWCVRNSRPDLAFEVTELSMKMKEGTVGDFKRAKKCIKKLKTDTHAIYYPSIKTLKEIKLEVFSDASFANLEDRVSSAMGFVIFVTHKNRACCLGWRAGKVKRVVKSTLAAEALALSEGVGEAVYLQRMINELLMFSPPIIAHVDSKGLVDQLNSTKLVYERMLRIDIGIIKEMLERKQIEVVRWCSSDEQLADVLTKRGADGSRLMNALAQGSLI